VEVIVVKLLLGFFSGVMVCGLILFGMQWAMPTMAQTESTSDNLSMVELLPDIEKIYREALLTPLDEAGKQIYDEDVAEYYQLLLERSGLDRPDDGTN